MSAEADAILQGTDALTPVAVRRATFVQVSAQGSGIVDMGNSRFSAEFGTGFIPNIGETIQVLTIGSRHLILPARPLPGVGTVMTVAGGLVTVQTVIGTYTMPYVSPTAPSSGQLVGLSWSETPYVVGPLSIQPAGPAPVPDPGEGVVRSAVFQVIDTGSTDRGSVRWWTTQPRAGNSTYGAWFYGTQIRDTIPAGASMVSLEFFVSWYQRRGDAPRFALHDSAGKFGIPGFGGYTPWAPGDGWQTPPMAPGWFDALKAGGGFFGVGLNQGGDNIFSSRAQNTMTGALRISWRS